MVNVRLPIFISDGASGVSGSFKEDGVVYVRSEDVSSLAHWMHERLVEKGTFVPCFPHGQWLYTRLSAQVYLEKKDFVWLGGVLREILNGMGGFLDTLGPRARL